MDLTVLFVFFTAMLVALFLVGRSRSMAVARANGGLAALNSLPFYHGLLTAIWAGFPAVILLGGWALFQDEIIEAILVYQFPEDIRALTADEIGLVLNKVYNVAYGDYVGDSPAFVMVAANTLLRLEAHSSWLLAILLMLSMVLGAAAVWVNIKPKMRARIRVEKLFKHLLLGCSFIAILTTVGIVMSVLFESIRFFQSVSLLEFLFGVQWNPQEAVYDGQLVGPSQFGAVPLVAGTLLIAAIAMTVAAPLGLMSAIYLSEYAPRKIRSVIKPLLEILAGVPTVVYGFVAAILVAPAIRDIAVFLQLDQVLTVTSESALAAGLVMGVMIIPLISSISDDVINAVPQSLRDGALALGSTQSEVIKLVVVPAALPGLLSGLLLAASRAVGETMIVVMAAGLAANLTANPLDSVTTVTVQMVSLLVGDQEFDSPKTLAAFALGLMLFVMTFILNYISLKVFKPGAEQYE